MKKDRFYVKNLFISNFKPFKCQNPPQKISFIDKNGQNIHLMMLSGFNGYGKTSIFQAIEFILSGKIEIFQFKDTTKKYSEHISINELGKESLMVLEIENEVSKLCTSIIRYNPNVKACKEKECLAVYKDFDLYILSEPFDYHRFQDKITDGDIEKVTSDELSELLNENNLDEWLAANYLKQEQSSNLLFKSNNERVDFINRFINQDSKEYFEKFVVEDDRLSTEIKQTIDKLKNIKESNQKKQVDSIGDKPENQEIFKDFDIIWDKLEYDDKEDFETYLLGFNKFKSICENLELFVAKDKQDGIKELLNQPELLTDILIYKFMCKKLSSYLEDYNKKKYLIELSSSQDTLISEELNDKYMSSELINKIKSFRESSETLNQLSSDKEKLYFDLKTLRKNILKEATLLNDLFNETCPLCGHNHVDDELSLTESIVGYDEIFLGIHSLIDCSNEVLVAKLELEYKHLDSIISKLIESIDIDEEMYNRIKEIHDKDNEYLKYQERLEYFLDESLDVYNLIGDIKLSTIGKVYDKVILSLNQCSLSSENKLNGYEFSEIDLKNLESNRDFLKKLINYSHKELLEKLNKKEKVLKWHLSKRQFENYSNEIYQHKESSEKLKNLLIRSKKVKKLLESVKVAKNQYMTDLVRFIEIPLYIYSGKLMQTHQNGLGVFCTTGSSEDKVTQFKLTTNGNISGHDIVNKFSAGQKAVMNIAVILAFRKIRSASLDLFMIDDPCQSMDDINVASLTEILRNEFDNTQILISTHDDNTSGYMCYKYNKIGKKYKNLNVQETFYSLE